MRLGIGTAQFGFDYGITNHTGKVPEKDAHRIISMGLEYGIVDVDTAPSYGTAEEVLGQHPLKKNLKITTKTVLNEKKYTYQGNSQTCTRRLQSIFIQTQA